MARRAALRVIAASPLELLFSGGLLDHAERSEAAQLLSVRPDLVRLDLFEEGGNAVIGEDPRGATREEGEKLLADGVEAWTDALARWDTQAVLDFYLRWERDYLPYRSEFYRESWEQAIADWWRARSGNR